MNKSALITGITGQDGAYLAKFLLEKGYQVFGLIRRLSTPNLWRLKYLGIEEKIELIEGDMLDEESLNRAVKKSKAEEIYNLAAQSFVGTSWNQAILTSEINGLGVTKILNTITNFAPKARFYQASTSEMFGNSNTNGKQGLNTPFKPRSPYAISKLYGHHMTINYRESYNLFSCCGILFNHESPLRGIEFVTRKITDGVARIKAGLAKKIKLGNLEAKRDWGFAGDYVEAMWLMLQKEKPEDYIIGTGENHSVREFLELTFKLAEINDWQNYVVEDPAMLRPAEVNELKAEVNNQKLGFRLKVSFEKLVEIMYKADFDRVKKEIN